MQMLSLIALCFAAVAASASPASRPNGQQWLYEHGWDGTTLPPIGTPLNSTGPGELTALAVGGVFICSDINWGGKCGHAVQPLNTCITLGTDWKDQISSFGPDQCTHCTAWVHNDCTDLTIPGGSPTWIGHWDFDYPGDATGGRGTSHPWNDRIESFKCHQVSC